MFSFLFFLVIFFSCIFWANNLIILCYSDWNEKKRNESKFCAEKERNSNNCQCAVKPNCFVYYFFFVCASVFNIFLKYSNSWMPFGYWKKRLDDVQKIWHKYGKTKQSRSEHTLAKKCWNKQKTIFFSAKTADQYHRYLHLEPNFYDNLSRSLATNASLKGNT